MPELLKGKYRPRNPKKTDFYRSIAENFVEFERVYPERYQEKYGFLRPVVREVVEKFLDCGDLHPSCHQRRVLQSEISFNITHTFMPSSPMDVSPETALFIIYLRSHWRRWRNYSDTKCSRCCLTRGRYSETSPELA